MNENNDGAGNLNKQHSGTQAYRGLFDFYLNGTIASDRSSVPVGGIIPFDLITGAGDDILYNAGAGTFDVCQEGLYFFAWGFTVTPVPGLKTVQINLEIHPAPYVYHGLASPAAVPVVNGSAVLIRTVIGESLGFINRSDAPVDILTPGPGFTTGCVSIFRVA